MKKNIFAAAVFTALGAAGIKLAADKTKEYIESPVLNAAIEFVTNKTFIHPSYILIHRIISQHSSYLNRTSLTT